MQVDHGQRIVDLERQVALLTAEIESIRGAVPVVRIAEELRREWQRLDDAEAARTRPRHLRAVE